MKVLILGLNYAPERVGIAVYTAGMAEILTERGHQVEVVAGQPYYPEWRVRPGYSRFWYSATVENGVRITRCPHYVPSRPGAARRILHYLSFALTSLFPTLWAALTRRPDIVVAVAPALAAAPVARIAARLCGAKAWLHIQDFEIDAAIGTGLVSGSGSLVRLARAVERGILGSFDTVSTISPQMCRKLHHKGVAADRIFEFRNWADLGNIAPLRRPSAFRQRWGITTPYVALYSGNIANKQGLEIIVQAARRLAHRTDLTFVICGDGTSRANLETQAAGLTNLQFHGLEPHSELNELLALATVHLLPQLAGAAGAVLPSKLTNMLASGRPVIATAAPGSDLAIEIDGCGIATPPQDAEQFAAAIEQLLNDADLRHEFSQAAYARALERWSPASIFANFDRALHALTGLATEFRSA
ncbi:WcaI family glycosyltransferase [Devosia alba]|uniref:WcaI family glycosyltransferase n=1 Tax=Devosia alba TaxID=3152360 RepID=UPI0032655525